MKKKIYALSFILILLACSPEKKKPEEPLRVNKTLFPELYASISEQDKLLFNAFNEHDAGKLKNYFTDSLEFFHDTGGFSNYTATMKNFSDLFERNKTTGLRRDLMPGTQEVYPIKGYGAVQTGLHTFCHKENGKDDCGTFKFMHIWQFKNGKWKITIAISYNH